MFTLYSLTSSDNFNEVRYLGYTGKPIAKRLQGHLYTSKSKKTYKDKWIQSEVNKGNKIIIDAVDYTCSPDEVKQKEIDYIKYYKSLGYRLTNGTDGADGTLGLKRPDLSEHNKAKRKTIYVFNYLTGEYFGEYSSQDELCDKLKLTKRSVVYVLAGKYYHHKNLWFSHSKEFNPIVKRSRIPWNKKLT